MTDQVEEFSSELDAKPIRIDGEDYEIREMAFGPRKKYLAGLGKTMEVRMVGTGEEDEKGREKLRKEIKILDMSGAQEDLLSNCMFKITEGKPPVPVSKDTIHRWGARMVERLAKIAYDFNGLDQSEEEEQEQAEKN